MSGLASHSAYRLTDLKVGLPGQKAINEMSDREAMGIAEIGLAPIDVYLRPALQMLWASPPPLLVELVEDASVPYETRHSAGILLGLFGDPRIKVLDPTMIEIEPGTYEVGLRADRVDQVHAQFTEYGVRREWIEKEAPAHTVEIKGFRIGKYPVTNTEYAQFLRESGSQSMPTSWPLGLMPIGTGNTPVYTIGAEEADEYAAWLSSRTGKQFRLPTEVEWEVAAKGRSGFEYPWGEEFIADHANTLESGILCTTPVGIFPAGASIYGCMDLAGNVEEYVADDYVPYPGGVSIEDDLTRRSTGYRIARGGSFARYRDLARCRRRHGYYSRPIYAMGFRLAQTVG